MQPSSHSWKWIHCNLIYQVHCILPFLAVNTGIYCWVLCRFFVIFCLIILLFLCLLFGVFFVFYFIPGTGCYATTGTILLCRVIICKKRGWSRRLVRILYIFMSVWTYHSGHYWPKFMYWHTDMEPCYRTHPPSFHPYNTTRKTAKVVNTCYKNCCSVVTTAWLNIQKVNIFV